MKILLGARVGITGVHRDSLSLMLEGGGCPDGDPLVPLGKFVHVHILTSPFLGLVLVVFNSLDAAEVWSKMVTNILWWSKMVPR